MVTMAVFLEKRTPGATHSATGTVCTRTDKLDIRRKSNRSMSDVRERDVSVRARHTAASRRCAVAATAGANHNTRRLTAAVDRMASAARLTPW
jgi:hypothetical protein